MKRMRWVHTVVLLVSLATAVELRAEEPSAQTIIDTAGQNNAFGFANAIGKVTVTVHKGDAAPRVRQLEIRSLESGGILRTLVRFLNPADVAGTGFLTVESPQEKGTDEQYLYLPALGKTKRITGRQRDEKFMGTDLTYADIQARNSRSGTLQRLPDSSVGGKPVYVVSATPADPQDSPYSRTLTYVHQESGVALKVEFFDAHDAVQKVLTVRRLAKQDGHWVAMESQVEDVQRGSKTLMHVDQVTFGARLSAADFTQQALAGG